MSEYSKRIAVKLTVEVEVWNYLEGGEETAKQAIAERISAFLYPAGIDIKAVQVEK